MRPDDRATLIAASADVSDTRGVSKSRLEAFSDAVFAIAVTLLVIELAVPDVHEGESLANALADEWPHYAAYAVSFAIVGIIWVNHHHVMDEVARVTRGLTYLNLGLLSTVAFLPHPTAVLAEYVQVGGSRSHVAAAVYSGTLLVMSLWFLLFWMHVVRARLHDPGIAGAGLRRRTRRAFIAPVAYAVVLGIAFVSAPLALGMHAAIAVYYTVDTAR